MRLVFKTQNTELEINYNSVYSYLLKHTISFSLIHKIDIFRTL